MGLAVVNPLKKLQKKVDIEARVLTIWCGGRKEISYLHRAPLVRHKPAGSQPPVALTSCCVAG